MKILLVEDDESLIAVLTKSLLAHHYVVDTVKDGEMGWNYGSTFEYDLMVLDIMLPKLDGISLCQRFRAEGYTTPILLLTAQDTSTTKVKGLDAGADDYVVKPFDGLELIARIRALLRRTSVNPLPLLTWGDLFLNPSTCEVTYNSQPLILTTQEYRLLELLLWDSQHVFSTTEILDRLWSSEEFPAEATVRSHIRRLRHKLVAAGAPFDFIATVHGRGYYLKAPGQEARLQPPESPRQIYPCVEWQRQLPADWEVEITAKQDSGEIRENKQDPMPHAICDRHPEQQAQYLKFLNETWVTTRPKSLEQLTVLSQALKDLQADSLNCQLQEQAQHIAHKLAGTLGTFGLTKGMQIARKLEDLLNSYKPLQIQQAALMETLVSALQQEIYNNTSIQSNQSLSFASPQPLLSSDSPQDPGSPLLLIVVPDPNFTESLTNVAASYQIRTAIAPTIEAATTWLNSTSYPQAILLQLPSVKSGCETTDFLEWLQMLSQHHLNLPIFVVGDRSNLTDRLEVVRHGGKLFWEPSIAPQQAIAAVMQLLSGSDMQAKVMIVDDDQDWLRTLPMLLNPWGFKVTTLAEPQQFWTVLQAVNPDVLVLDVNMPQINGFELCQVVRSDPRWRQLPILFLSVLSDAKTQNQAFNLGADDYLCKPVIAVDLANRIRNRLQRVRAWAS
ncbi:response regulator [Nostoc sp. CENA67]|uniref:Response regulator n=1 Tax=Amazonocrinis nigriterrae CENA67 TaxID=2794033 RepID=A0A8J7HSR2_9NOST|nr:response regulator [Amazonocrinis nigriterrae]MBH8563430.1 response regulator [Amazonocrinis nigriterrae CENA67]